MNAYGGPASPTGRLRKAGFGYGDDETVLTKMRGRFSRIQIRTDFVIADLEQVNNLYLYVNYDDGFVAYINGEEATHSKVAERNGGLAAGNREVAEFEEFVVRNARSLLKSGRNVLAIEGFNRTIDSSDFSLHPALSMSPEANVNSLPIA